MKHVALILAALVLLAFAGVIVVPNRTHLTLVHLSFAGGAVVLALLLAIPADAKDAISTLASYLPAARGTGSRNGGKPDA